MKKRKKILIALNAALVPVLSVLPNLISSNFPFIPALILWVVAGAIFMIAIIISVIISVLEDEKEETQAALQVSSASQKVINTPIPSARSQAKNKMPQPITSATSPSSPTMVSTAQSSHVSNHQPTVEHPLLISLAVDVSYSMKKTIIDHTGKTIQRWASVKEALEHFAYLGGAWFKDPATQRVLPLYHLMAYGFGFTEKAYKLGMSKKPGGEVRDLLQHPSLTPLPSALEISEHWRDYQDNLLSHKKYTLDLFGTSPMCQALTIIRDRIKQERMKNSFAIPSLLLIISDGLPDDGDPVSIVQELHDMDVMTLCCYLADQDVLATKRLYDAEENNWSDGAKLLFHCASPLQRKNNVSCAIFDYFSDAGWNPYEGARLFAQVNQTEGLNTFLEILLSGSLSEKRG